MTPPSTAAALQLNRPGKQRRVAPPAPVTGAGGVDDVPLRLARRIRDLRPSAIREILKTTEAPEVISFAGGLPAPELFPVAAVAEAAAAILRDDGPAALQYGTTEGYRPLRQWVAGHLARTVGWSVPPEQVLITSGSQQGLDLLGRVFLDPGDLVLVENPAYLGALQAFRTYEADIVGVPTDDDGIQPDALRRALEGGARRPKFIYLIPNFQNPTGCTTSATRRVEIAALAARFGVPLVEDDPYGQLRYNGAAPPALVAQPGAAGGIYLGTSSKILAPGLRVAWLATANRSLFERLVTAKQAADLHTSSFTQRLVCRWVAQPAALDAHVGRLRSAYARRRDAMLDALARHFPAGCTWSRPDGGLFLWVRAPAGLDTTRLLPAATAQQVAYVPGEPFWVGPAVRHTLRLNFSNSTEDRIEEGMRRLGRALKAALARPL
jgi:2-aminoadipate transaminase